MRSGQTRRRYSPLLSLVKADRQKQKHYVPHCDTLEKLWLLQFKRFFPRLKSCECVFTTKRVPTCSWCRAAGSGWCVWWLGPRPQAASPPGRSGTTWSPSRGRREGPRRPPDRWRGNILAAAETYCRRPPRPLHPRRPEPRTCAGPDSSGRRCWWWPPGQNTESGRGRPRWRVPLPPRSQPTTTRNNKNKL